jgi:hypothetical protein
MVKKMIYLDEPRQLLLRKLAAREHVSETEVMRRALDEYALALSRPDPLLALIGIAGGERLDGSINHTEQILDGPRDA